jgi:hypothetical protein
MMRSDAWTTARTIAEDGSGTTTTYDQAASTVTYPGLSAARAPFGETV